ncbi:hypothetical protein INT45_012598 [Circinella minor]|uniref:Endonuclease/exonuclease/phosphatase domain-containing protein n=1 Tax=Circinella minor TaxID=1195481 RepID=A0A8H7RMI6_9FUNG|nr:hypothetical protein INT45_012598 [Circinella minor]
MRGLQATHGSTIILGDLNTRLASQTGDQRDNNRAPFFRNWLLDHGLVLWNETLTYGMATFYKPSVGSSIIDFLISAATAVRALSLVVRNDLAFGSDHHLCQFEFLTNTPLSRLPAPNAPRLHWKLQRLHEDDVLAIYVDEFTRNIAPISVEIDHHLAHNDLDLNAIEQIGQKITTTIYDALDHSDDFITARKALRLAIRRSRTQHWREFCKRMQRHNPSEANSVIKRIRRNRLQPVTFSHPDSPAQAANTMSYVPVAWRTAQVVPIYTKDDPTPASNYQPISLTSSFRKVIERCLLPVLLNQMPALDVAQGGFRVRRGALDQAFNL